VAVWLIRSNDVVAAIDDLNAARIAYIMLAASPVVFSSVLFSILLEGYPEVDRALGANLVGAMAGGCLEYAAMIVGYKALTVAIPVTYIAAMALWWSARRSA
jgi:hypothetical protein